MLNKGPHIVDAIRFLDDVFARMHEHHDKRTTLLRRLSISDAFNLPIPTDVGRPEATPRPARSGLRLDLHDRTLHRDSQALRTSVTLDRDADCSPAVRRRFISVAFLVPGLPPRDDPGVNTSCDNPAI